MGQQGWCCRAGVRVALTHQGPTGFAGQQPGAPGRQLPVLAPSTRARQGFGDTAGGVRKKPAVPEGLPRDQLGSQEVPRGLAASWVAPQVSAQFHFQPCGAMAVSWWPTPAPGGGAGGRRAAGCLRVVKAAARAVLSNPAAG